MAIFAAIMAFISLGSAIVFSMMIVHEVSKRGVKINFFLLKLYVVKYVDQYKQLTLKETGKTGPLYLPCVGSYVSAFVFAIIYLISR
ncbi:MAG TPA: hypothetical protein P5119_01585 [Candidatus Aminicenantes bacterium]|nr:hypothetical protein [Candidatus Aminicenantes bacterium]HRY64016.1 hypothetical protein [Candidatus Aminicenantes bacterium]HRZ70929.1 hypothetical protein [Candidatus Aminicenantes bacterium]